MELYIPILLNLCFLLSMCLGNIRMDPRLIHPQKGIWSFPLPREEANAVFYLSKNNSLYVGGDEILYHFNFDTMNNDRNYTIEAESKSCSGKIYCKNYVTFVGELLGKLIVCGTNAYRPGCWTMDGDKFQKLTDFWSEQMAPQTPTPVTKYNILITENQVYSTLPRRSNNGISVMKTLFRKIHGDNPLLYTGEKFLRSPEFVKSLVVEKQDKVQNKILLFFTEDNTETRTLQKRLPMVAQLCKEESGADNSNTRYTFSSALKSRIICGDQLNGQYYPYLQDIYFLQGKNGNVIYGLFKNSWGHSAVCSYEVEDIELLFNTSSLLGSSKKDLKIRPGTCLPNPELTPEETSAEASNYPELKEWLWPSTKRTVFQNLDHYRNIVVDEITAVNQETYRVLLLAKDDGTVHKVVELEDGASNILQVTPFKHKGKLQFMKLEPNEHVLYMGTTHEISRLTLDDCTVYNTSCTECIQSRDPFCGWIEGKCDSILKYKSSLVQQNLTENATCASETNLSRPNLEKDHPESPDKEMYASQHVFKCSTGSTHAYIRKNDDNKTNLIINEVTKPGEYKCVVEEIGRESEKLKQTDINSATRIQCIWLLVLIIQLLM